MATTDNIKIDPGTTTALPTYDITEDAITKELPRATLNDSTGAEVGVAAKPLQVSVANTAANSTAIKVDNSAVTQPVSGTVTANIGTSGSLALDATLTGGTQKTKIVDTGGTNVASVSAAGAVKVDGSAVTQPVSGTVTVNAGTNLNTSALALDTSVNGILVAQGSTTSGQNGPIVQTATTTNAPTYTTAKTNPLNTTTGGALRSDVTTIAGTAPTTAGKLDVKAADGDVFVRQATASNLQATVFGARTNNNAAPGTNHLGVLPAVANAAPQTWTEGNAVLASTDLSGNVRVTLGTRIDPVNDSITTYPYGHSYTHLSANGTTTVKSGAGVLSMVTVNTAGASANTLTLYDNTAGSGTVIAVIDSTSKGTLTYNIAFTTGLTAVLATGTAADVTLTWR